MYSEANTFLAIPGPVEIHPRVYKAMNEHIYGHRTSHFREIYKDCVDKFKETINTTSTPQFHAGSGTLGLHAAVTNLVTKEDHVLNLVNGKFGERVEKITNRFTSNSKTIRVDYGLGITSDLVKHAFEENPDISLVTITHNETSTGVLNPLPEISKVVHENGALLMADCITSAGGDLVEMDKWKIDFFVSGSQKCYGLPPGLSFISFNEQAEEVMKKNEVKRDFYSDLILASDTKLGVTPFTPPVGLIYGLKETLQIIMEEGMENRIARHRKMGELYRNAMTNLGLELFAQEGFRSNTVTTTKVPKNANPDILSKTSLELGIMIAGGQGSMKGNIFRVGHMNMVGPRELLTIVGILEIALKRSGASIHLGEGVKIVQEGLIGN